MNKYVQLISVGLICWVITGCEKTKTDSFIGNIETIPVQPTTKPDETVTISSKELETVKTVITKSATVIDNKADTILATSPTPAVVTTTKEIKQEAGLIYKTALSITDIQSSLSTAVSGIGEIKGYITTLLNAVEKQNQTIKKQGETATINLKKIGELQDEITDLKSKKTTLITLIVSIIGGLSLIGVGVSVYLAINGAVKQGWGLGIGSIVVGVLCVSILTYWNLYAIAGGIGLILLVVGTAIWIAISNTNKTKALVTTQMQDFRQAFKDVVVTTEGLKKGLDPKTVFETGGFADTVQTAKTKELVATERTVGS